MGKILVIGDLHLRESLPYNEYVKDGRIPEKKEVLDFIIKASADCDSVVLLGDSLNSKNNASSVVKEFVNFIEQFGKKKLYILSGNHELISGGRTAIDFLKEISDKNWNVITNEVTTIGKYTFCPYFTKKQLEVETNEEATKKLMKQLKGGDLLFVHLAISDTLTSSGVNTNIFNEIVLPKKELEKMYKLVVVGHIHAPSTNNQTIISGSIFNQEIGELQKYIWKVDEETLKVEQIKLPGRAIYELNDPTDKELTAIKKDSIVKVIITEKKSATEMSELREKLKKFDAYLILEKIPSKREKLHFGEGEGILDFSIDKLLETYALAKKIDIDKLKAGFELIR